MSKKIPAEEIRRRLAQGSRNTPGPTTCSRTYLSIASAMMEARAGTGLTQEQLAEKMHTTQADDRAVGKGPGQALDPHARTAGRGDRHAAQNSVEPAWRR
jgi:ribosome-binding protein aMBF1 (putative translation factor)